MLSRFVASSLVVAMLAGFVLAGEYRGSITEHKDGKITLSTYDKETKKADKKTLKVAKGVKITKGEDEVKADDFDKLVSDAAEKKGRMKGVFAKVTTDDKDNVTKIELIARKGGKKKKE